MQCGVVMKPIAKVSTAVLIQKQFTGEVNIPYFTFKVRWMGIATLFWALLCRNDLELIAPSFNFQLTIWNKYVPKNGLVSVY